MDHQAIWNKPRRTDDTAFIGGHRGASVEASENSKEAFEQAILLGADFIEFDWRLTRDHVPVVFHDKDLRRLRNDQRAIEDVTLPELEALGPGIMTVKAALETARGRISVLLDTKITDPETLLVGLDLLSPWLTTSVAFGTRSLHASQVVRKRMPESAVLGLFDDPADYADLHAMGGRWARLWEEDSSLSEIQSLQDRGLKVIVMVGQDSAVGVITPDAMENVLFRRPDAVMLNDVALGLAARTRFQAIAMSNSNTRSG
jgi:glycerophosphoryl diester phosphodiesterase